jgi:hypothetical protein
MSTFAEINLTAPDTIKLAGVRILQSIVTTATPKRRQHPSCQSAAGHVFRFSEFSLTPTPNQWHYLPRPVSTGGTLRGRHGRGRRDAVDVSMQRDERHRADGEIVWSWRRDAGVKFAS